MLLGRCWFDRARTERARECLAHYHRDFNDKMGVFRDAPVHDWSSHGADALRTLAMGIQDAVRLPVAPKPQVVQRDYPSRGATSWMTM
jgi:hypothetical protein